MVDESLAKRLFKDFDKNEFSQVSIKIASPEIIRSWSHGEVKNPETINYRTFKPERGGLFCERIFGPTKDWECSCGKYKRIKHKGIVCDRCGVEVTQAKVRRERMGHIELAVSVAHIWFFKTQPSRIGNVLGMSSRLLERVLYYEDYIVIDPGTSPLEKKQLLNEAAYRDALSKYGKGFTAKMGADAVQELLAQEDLNVLAKELKEEQKKTRSIQAKKKLSKRLKIAEGLVRSGNRAEWMILNVVPVIPPDLRPLVPLEGGRFATSDLNDLYRRVINRNNRLRTILQMKTPDVIVRNEKRMLQEAVDALFDNGRHGRPVLGTGNRPLKSISDMLKGKQGRFRQNLLGKRVDYSARAVIVVGPELKLNQCGLPKKIALELFEPFIIRKLKDRGLVHTIRSAKKLIETGSKDVWDILDEVTKGHPVLLNRAPTLHRLGIQAFEPVLIEGEAIRIHPLVCTAFNADFDGDQMAVHMPLSVEAQLETKTIILATNNIFSPSNGKPIVTPTQDIVLGCYYLTKDYRKVNNNQLPRMCNKEEVLMAFDHGVLKIHDPILLQLNGQMIRTTVGRVKFNEVIPSEMGYINEELNKKNLSKIIMRIYNVIGHDRTIQILDDIKSLGFREATQSGISIALADMLVPGAKTEMIIKAQKEVERVQKQYQDGSITDGERYNKIIDIWTHATDTVADTLFKGIEDNYGRGELNPLFMMVDSGARGSKQQIRQLAGMRGLMARPSGEIIEHPIISNFKEGLTVREYFISTHGARKGLADTALKTADSGYLTRRLVDVTQDVIVREIDCGTLNGITVQPIYEGDEEVVTIDERIHGRVTADDIVNPRTGEVIVEADHLVTREKAHDIEDCGIASVRIRSVLACESRIGVCAKCYGLDLSTGRLAGVGAPIGIIAAQSIGEPGTQLTMRTFHIGGTASSIFKQPQLIARHSGTLQFRDMKTVVNKLGKTIVLNKTGTLALVDENGNELEKHSLTVGAVIQGKDGSSVTEGDIFITWDPYNVPVLSEQAGYAHFHDIVEGQTVKRELDSTTGLYNSIITDHKGDLHPQIIVTQGKDRDSEILGYYSIPVGAHLSVQDGQKMDAGSLLAKTPRKIFKTKDITGGLPRVAELFEARQPKDAAEIAKIDGIVEFRGTVKGKRLLVIRDEITGIEEEHLIAHKKHLTVFHNYRVKKGQQLTEGPIIPHEILEVCGPMELQEYLVNQVQEVYRLQGVEINDKHVEIIIRQMLKKVRITDPGDTQFLYNDQIDKHTFREVNEEVARKGGKTAEAAPLLLGITKASLGIESFISAASFQETTRVLTEAATEGKIDYLRGFKENIIMGHLITAGTGAPQYRKIVLKGPQDPEENPFLVGSEEPAVAVENVK